MYDYHNYLRATHPASSPWWAWPLDLKPVWFEQSELRRRHHGRHLRHRQPGRLLAGHPGRGVGLLAGVEAPQPGAGAHGHRWSCACGCPGRASTAPRSSTTSSRRCRSRSWRWPTSWPSCGTAHRRGRGAWPRSAPRLAIIGAPLLWLFRQPLCGLANTQQVNKGTEVCGALSRTSR